MRSTILLACIFFSMLTTAQQKYTPAELHQDLKVARQALEEAHAGFYRYRSKAETDKSFIKLEHQLNKDMTELQFLKLLNPFLAGIKDGHTKFHRDGKPDDHYAFHEKGYFPFQLYFVNSRAFLRNSYLQDQTLESGTEIISINKQPISGVIKTLFNQIFADGDVTSSKYQELNMYFEGYYADYMGVSKSFQIGYMDSKGKKQTGTFPSVSKEQVKKEQPKEDPLKLSYPQQGTALLRIPVFFEHIGNISFEDFLKNSFAEIRKHNISSLILDLRDNEGGSEKLGILLYSYLSDTPFNYYDHLNVASKGPFSFAKHATFPPAMNEMLKYVEQDGGEFRFKMLPGLGLQQPQPETFKGKVYLLQNGRSFSVTSEFAAIAKTNKRAILVGEESGGAYKGNTSGDFTRVSLPNTKLGLDIPLLAFHMHLKDPAVGHAGVPVDYFVLPTIADILKQRDVILEKTLTLIKP
ncbi:S41 family peptidase [Pedobacter sp. B4-66]|uniref:S41 family peptidase n=1 Tax=Pedobacter sp. B4-66 TaxID=2817280 RepID=UPI001BDA009D|nr:S41 family peptidase [Pedobacter sp. B4-66]